MANGPGGRRCTGADRPTEEQSRAPEPGAAALSARKYSDMAATTDFELLGSRDELQFAYAASRNLQGTPDPGTSRTNPSIPSTPVTKTTSKRTELADLQEKELHRPY